jgi:toxin ParE1/3/4
VRHSVVFSPEARDDLFELYDFIAQRDGAARALGFVERIEVYCLGLADFPKRGSPRDAVRPGLRVVGFGRRTTVAFHVAAKIVTIDRVLYGGRDLGSAFPRKT